jgi:hypothetical protein
MPDTFSERPVPSLRSRGGDPTDTPSAMFNAPRRTRASESGGIDA